jgi:tetratricopeptide (TPR) repeat protein
MTAVTNSTARGRSTSADMKRAAAFGGILLLAAVLRVPGVVSGELLWHPDEMVFGVARPIALLSGDLNPHFFTYPSFHLYQIGAVYAAAATVDVLTGDAGSLRAWAARHLVWDPETPRDLARWLGLFYSLAIVPVTALLAGRLRVPTASAREAILGAPGLLAALLAAVNVLLVRHAGLISTDVPLAFWMCLAVVLAVRLDGASSGRDYLLAGLGVGVCASTKYPGAVVAVAVIATHLLARRSLLDRRLWLAGATSVAVFVLLSPYVLLDASRFAAYFSKQLGHISTEQMDWDTGPLDLLLIALRHGLGTPAWIAVLAACLWTLWRRPRAHLATLAALVTAYSVVSWSELIYARYVLPVAPLLVALLADGTHRLVAEASGRIAQTGGRRARLVAFVLAVFVLAGVPAYGSWQVARLQTTPDTRSLARAWMESHLPPGSTVCNFGGWAGDVQAETFEGLWWRLRVYNTAFTDDLGPVRHTATSEDGPYYAFAVQNDPEGEKGSLGILHARECGYTVLHTHDLPTSYIDSTFRGDLATVATPLMRFDPGDGGAIFDPLDAYYLPLTGWAQKRPGPSIEIWETPRYQGRPRSQNPLGVLATAIALQGPASLDLGEARQAQRYIQRARSLDPDNPSVLAAAAQVDLLTGRLGEAEELLQRLHRLQPGSATPLTRLGELAARRGDHAAAVDYYTQARERRPGDAVLLNNLAVSTRALERFDRAVALWQEALRLQEDYAEARYNLGTALHLSGRSSEAAGHLLRAFELEPDSARYASNAAGAIRAQGDIEGAAALWSAALEADPTFVDAAYNLAYSLLHDLHRPSDATAVWERVRDLAPGDLDAALHHTQALLELGRRDEAIASLRRFLERNPRHPRVADVQRAIEQINETPP